MPTPPRPIPVARPPKIGVVPADPVAPVGPKGGSFFGASTTFVNGLLEKIEDILKRDDITLPLTRDDLVAETAGMHRRSPFSFSRPSTSTVKSSGSATGTVLLGSAAGGAASAVVGNVLNLTEGLFQRDDTLDALIARSKFLE